MAFYFIGIAASAWFIAIGSFMFLHTDRFLRLTEHIVGPFGLDPSSDYGREHTRIGGAYLAIFGGFFSIVIVIAIMLNSR